MKVAVIDNYDSFVYNLVRYVEDFTQQSVKVMRNNAIDFDYLETCDAILLSPGPGLPKEAGQLMDVLGKFHQTHKILGVCLGHQAIAEFFNGELINDEQPVHGKQSQAQNKHNSPILKTLPDTFQIGRYHSWSVQPSDSQEYETTCVLDDGKIMGIRHRNWDVEGVQFHPESILTPNGRELINNWLTNEL